jgi:membrane protease YdiL (CAAX protease family)
VNGIGGGRITPELPTGMTSGGPRDGRARPAGKNQQKVSVWPTLWLYLVVTWLAAGGLKVLQPATHLSMQVLTITQFAPSIAVLAVLATHRGAALRIWQGPAVATLRRIAVGVGVLAGVFGLCLAGMAVTGQAIQLTSPGSLGEPFWLIAVAQLVGACGEELGWRSFLQPHLQQRYSPVVSALIVGTLWGTWHVEYFSDGLLFVAIFVTMAVAISVILAELTRGVSSLAVAGVFHWLLNLAILLLLNFANGDLADVTALAAGFVLAAVVLWSWGRWGGRELYIRNAGETGSLSATGSGG